MRHKQFLDRNLRPRGCAFARKISAIATQIVLARASACTGTGMRLRGCLPDGLQAELQGTGAWQCRGTARRDLARRPGRRSDRCGTALGSRWASPVFRRAKNCSHAPRAKNGCLISLTPTHQTSHCRCAPYRWFTRSPMPPRAWRDPRGRKQVDDRGD
jgi:hypothetical protein